MQKLEQRDYAKAETFLRKLLENEDDGQSSVDGPLIQLKIAFVCCFQSRWDEAESIAVPIAMSKDWVEIVAFHILHAFSLRASQHGQLDQAARWCKRALWGKKKLLGKNDPSYYESMALLARLYDLQESAVEAEACRNFAPSNTIIDEDPLLYLFKSISGSWKSNSGGRATLSTSSTQPMRSTPSLLTTPLIESPPPIPNAWRPPVAPPRQSSALRDPVSGPNGKLQATSNSAPKSHIRSSSRVSAKLMDSPRLIICIDFGTTFTGVVYSFTADELPTLNRTETGTVDAWPMAGDRLELVPRIPTVLYYDADLRVVGWSSDIAEVLAPRGYPKPSVLKTEWFRVRLYTDHLSRFSLDLRRLPSRKTLIDVIADYHFHLRLAVLTYIGKQYPTLKEPQNCIEWRFTIPPSIPDSSKKDYQSALLQAGFTSTREDAQYTFIDVLQAGLHSALAAGIVTIELHKVILVVKCGGYFLNSQAFELVKQKPLKFIDVTALSSDTCA